MPIGISYRALAAAAGFEVGAPADAYIVNSFAPPVVADFAGILNSGTEYYRVGGSDSTFDSMFTFSETTSGLRTMTDSDGNLKWAPHNLFRQSNTFSDSAWTKQNGTVAQNAQDADGTANTAWTLTSTSTGLSRFYLSTTLPTSAEITIEIEAKAGNVDYVYIQTASVSNEGVTYFNVNTGSVGTTDADHTASITSLGNGFWRCSITYASGSDATGLYLFGGCTADGSVATSVGATSIFAYARAYRSDLGGMVDNPNRGDSSVQTTTAAVYQARRNHYRWNGSSYVNKGILLESEARTNLITSSDDMSGWTTSNMTVAKNQTGADGVANSAHSLTATSGSATVLTTITAASNPHVYSALVKRITGTGTIEMTVNGGTNWINVTSLINSSEFIQVGTGAGTTVTNPQVGFRITTSGDAIAVQVNQLEQTSGQFSSPIPTSGATVTRAAETLTIAGANMSYSASAMSLHMTGDISYVDNNDSSEVWFSRWGTTSSSWILTLLNTASTRTGELRVDKKTQQWESGASIQISPGTNVPYNLAWRMTGSNHNGAMDGVAGTDNTTSLTIGSLAATQMELYYNGGGPAIGTLALFRQWAADIGDTGIESATS